MVQFTFQRLNADGVSGRDEFFAQFAVLIQAVTSWSKWHFDFHVREELVQQVRTELVRAEAELAKSQHPERLVKTICVRRCIDEVRRQLRQRAHFVSLDCPALDSEADGSSQRDVPTGSESDPVQIILQAERAALLARAVGNLDATCQTAIQEFYTNELSYKEISGKLGISVNTVGSRLAKCLAKLKALIQDDSGLKEDLTVPLD
jgi:RNA polymerase sigma factor (sigma-70 family)